MPGPTSAKKLKDARVEQAGGHAHEQSDQPALWGPHANILAMQRTAGNQAIGRLLQHGAGSFGMIQTKLSVGQPKDRHEQEADRVAQQVMQMPVSRDINSLDSPFQIQGQCAACGAGQKSCPKCAVEEKGIQRKLLVPPIIPSMQRQMKAPKLKKGEEELLRINEMPASTPEAGLGAAARMKAMQGGGQPLPQSLRAFFEPRFGYDFSHVRVHTDARAAQTARELYARAYTSSADIVFAPGEYMPGAVEGRRLLAHELVHVIQQHGAPSHVLQRQIRGQGECVPGVDREKSSPELEQWYRERGQTTQADAIRACCRFGGDACAKILTQEDLTALYARGPSGEVLAAFSGVAAASRSTGVTSAFRETAQEIANRALRGTARPSPETAAGSSSGARWLRAVSQRAGIPVALAAIVTWQLIDFAAFQKSLIEAGYIILDDPLAICIQACHTQTPLFAPRPLRDLPPELLAPPPDLLKEIGRWPVPPIFPQPHPEPLPQPRPREEERRRRRCDAVWKGRNETEKTSDFTRFHNAFAREMVVRLGIFAPPDADYSISKGGLKSTDYDSFDAETLTLYEFKTLHEYLLVDELNFRWEVLANRLLPQATDQHETRKRCEPNATLIWIWDNEKAASGSREELQAVGVDYVTAERWEPTMPRPRRRSTRQTK